VKYGWGIIGEEAAVWPAKFGLDKNRIGEGRLGGSVG